MAAITNEDIFGDDEAPEPASVIIPGSPSDNSATSDEDNSPSSVKTKGTAPSSERLTMQQKLKAVQHFEKNRMSQKDLGECMYKNLMLKKPSGILYWIRKMQVRHPTLKLENAHLDRLKCRLQRS